MKFLFKVILIAGLSYFAELFLSWWIVVLVAFLTGLILPTKGFNDFLSGFLGVGLLWLIFAWSIDTATDSLLTEQVAPVLFLSNHLVLIAMTGLIGGIMGGFGCLAGSQLRRIFMPDLPTTGYVR